MKDALEIAVEAAMAAGKIQRDRSQNIGRISSKGSHDLVTEVDFLCEEEVIRIIKKRFPDHQFLAEESGADAGCHAVTPIPHDMNVAGVREHEAELAKIVETFRKTIEKKLTVQTVNQLSSFVIHVLMILAAQALMVVLLNITGK